MEFNPILIANQIASHDLINTYIYPEKPMHLGEKDRYTFRDAEVALRKCGNRYGQPTSATTISYAIVGDGFRVSLRAVWAHPEDATAKVTLLEVLPPEGGPIAYNCWLRSLDAQEEAA